MLLRRKLHIISRTGAVETAVKKIIVSGNASSVMPRGGDRGWFVGHFIAPDCGPRCTGDVEVKWGEHVAGEERASTCVNQRATTLTLLHKGSFGVEFLEEGLFITLEQSGDYVVFGPGVSHTWKALADSTVLTVRWPSVDSNQ